MRLHRLGLLLIVVALASVAITVAAWGSVSRQHDREQLDRRRAAFESLAAYHQRKTAWVLVGCSKTHCTFSNSDGEVLTEEFKQYHRRLAAKYRSAAARPWLPVAPDPPPISTPRVTYIIGGPVEPWPKP